jgi:hypothetical protein
MATSLEALNEEIATQSALFNKLRLSNENPALLEEVKTKLGELKKELGKAKAAAGTKDAGQKKERLLLKTAKVCIATFFFALFPHVIFTSALMYTGNARLWSS